MTRSEPLTPNATQAHGDTHWIKQPLAVFTANDADADNGIVIQNGTIVELVPKGRVQRACCAAGLGEYTPSFLSNTDPCMPSSIK